MDNHNLASFPWLDRIYKTIHVTDTSKQWEKIFIGFVLILGAWKVIPLIDTYYLYSFEPDSESTINISLSFINAIKNSNLKLLSEISGYPPYFDAQFLIYALSSLLLRLAQKLNFLNLEFSHLDQAFLIFTIRHTNALFNILSSIILFKIIRLISWSNWLSLLIVIIFVFNYQLSNMDLMRVDHVIMPLFLILSYSSFALINKPNLKFLSLAIGISLAFLVNIKFNTLMFAYVPAITIILLFWQRRYRVTDLYLLLVSFLVTSLILLLRYIIHFNSLLSVLSDRAAELKLWYAAMSKEPYFYYNWDYFLGYGYVFLLLFLISATTVFFSLFRRFSVAGFVALSTLIVFSGLGIASPKLERWGIHFIPVYLWIIAMGTTFWRWKLKSLPNAKVLKPFYYLMLAIALLQPSLLLFENHQLIVQKAEQKAASIQITRDEPRQWFIKNAPPGTRVAYYSPHSWANPPIFDLPLDFSSKILEYPYLETEEMASFMPPTLNQLEASVDVVMLESFHKSSHVSSLEEVNLLQQAEAWNTFYNELDSKYKRIDFKSEYENYGINEVSIYVISPNLLSFLKLEQ
ncbi:hypothetical protein H6F98_14015 [Microcoleus sp. FACHB-SPT15]|uniref:hypothetical protein n=1 Tax=Microcoleus sp. FACHB-SPT15 TaxID=2692830 RepID=UPI00177AAA2E|nr:hypothetical protein [Microcoleus sp. FACHB-SPT15]MBD1806563.1 hypothetical protein [Microcoleus sp. FACHB-SPT15]